MTENDLLRLGIVGCGGISHAHGRAAQALDDVRIAACCDVREDVYRGGRSEDEPVQDDSRIADVRRDPRVWLRAGLQQAGAGEPRSEHTA